MTVAAIVGWFERWKIALAIAFGIVVRLVCAVVRWGYWMDEASLLTNVTQLTPRQMFGPLLNNQLAPPGFLILAWLVDQVFGSKTPVFRAYMLVFGIGGIFLFLAVARRCLPTRAVFPAVLMFVSSNHLVYYASEFKQYATDLVSALGCWLIGLTVGARPLTPVRSVALALFGASIVWFSHPSIFVLAAVGLVGLHRAIATRERRSAGLWLVVGAAWLASFALVHRVSSRQLDGLDNMWRFWGFAFPPIPPRSWLDATWFPRRLAYFFINPLDFYGPFDPRISMLPAIGLALVGTVRIWREDRRRWALLFLPVIATVVATTFQLYPFHGRVILFLVPVPLIAIASGLDAVRTLPGRVARVLYFTLVGLVLVYPSLLALDQTTEQRWAQNTHGDLHPADIEPYRFPF